MGISYSNGSGLGGGVGTFSHEGRSGNWQGPASSQQDVTETFTTSDGEFTKSYTEYTLEQGGITLYSFNDAPGVYHAGSAEGPIVDRDSLGTSVTQGEAEWRDAGGNIIDEPVWYNG